MTIGRWLVLPALLAVSLPVAAEGAGYSKCTMSAQECLDFMVAKLAKKAWIGADFGRTEGGKLTVERVAQEGPAAKAGVRAGDVITAVNGVTYSDETREAIKKQWERAVPGETMTFTVSRGGHEKDLTVPLATMPRELLEIYIGNHMLHHVTSETAQEQKR